MLKNNTDSIAADNTDERKTKMKKTASEAHAVMNKRAKDRGRDTETKPANAALFFQSRRQQRAYGATKIGNSLPDGFSNLDALFSVRSLLVFVSCCECVPVLCVLHSRTFA